jgi:hypothetical protein
VFCARWQETMAGSESPTPTTLHLLCKEGDLKTLQVALKATPNPK